MREPARDRERLLHIQEALSNIKEFTDGIIREQLFSDKMRYFAVVKNIEIVGEAANMLTLEFREKHCDLPWKAIIGMRNVIVHDYINIHEDLLWDTVKNDIPELEKHISAYLKEFQNE